ncbi:MAG: glycosyltransferase [Candidatus Omnitrophota bacterium]|nr:glycosyltransferase [Candidatus Omnitrophota bacterium]
MKKELVSIIVPTYKEAGNIELLTKRIAKALAGAKHDYEILIVDDNSMDDTEHIVKALSNNYPIRLKIRYGNKDLSQAVVDGFRLARGDIFVVMDADLSHPPEKLPDLIGPVLREECDFSIGSRFIKGAGIEGFSMLRNLNAFVSRALARLFTNTSDPMSGLFCFRKDLIKDLSVLNPVGFKVGLEILVKSDIKRIKEIPFHFGLRVYGESKLSLIHQLEYIRHLFRLSLYKIKNNKQQYILWLFLLATLVRFVGIVRPLLGNFATKNVVYAMIAKNFAADPKTILYPTLDVLMNNKPSLHMTEWPFFAYFIGLLKIIFPFVNVDIAGRLFSIVFFMISAYLFYRFCRTLFGKPLARNAAIFYLFFPLGIIYGQSFLLESSAIFFITALFFNILRWLEGAKTFLRAFIVWFSFSMLLLMKIQMACLALPILVLILMYQKGRNLFSKPSFYIFSAFCLALPLGWYLHTINVANKFDNVYFSVIYSIKIRKFPDPLIFSVEFYLRVIKTLCKETFSPVGLTLGFIGFFLQAKTKNKAKFFVYAYILSMAVYSLIMASKIYEMNYYFIPLLIPGAILAAFGFSFFKTKPIKYILLATFLVSSIAIAFNPSFKTTENEKNFLRISKEINTKIAKDAKIVVSSDGCAIAFLYYIGHRGWIVGLEQQSLTDLQKKARESFGLENETNPIRLLEGYSKQGADYYVCDNTSNLRAKNPALYEHLINNYRPIEEKNYFLVDLSVDKS